MASLTAVRKGMSARVLRLSTVACTVVLVTALGVPSAGADSKVAEAATASSGEIALAASDSARLFRDQFGLRNETSFLIGIADAVNLDRDTYGVPLLASEVAELHRRDDLSQQINVVRRTLTPLGTFGGGWIDNKAGGVLNIAIVGDKNNIIPVIRRLLPDSVFAEANIVSRSMTEIEFTSLPDVIMASSPASWGISYATTDVLTGRALVHVSHQAPPDVESIIAERYNNVVDVIRTDELIQAAEDRVRGTGPLYGGLRIQSANRGGNLNCSVGYSNVRDSSGQYLMLTAGHCGDNGDDFAMGVIGSSQSRYIGKGQRDKVVSGSSTTCDCMVVGPIPGGTGTNGWLLNNDVVERIIGRHNAYDEYGNAVCHSGSSTMIQASVERSVVQCGQVVNTGGAAARIRAERGDDSVYYFNVSSMGEAAMTCLGGDSGTTVGNRAKLFGIVSYAGGENYTASARCGYSTINSIDNSLGVTLGYF